MARVNLASILAEVHGSMDERVYYNRPGKQCSRAYVIPHNPDTKKQRINRNSFANELCFLNP